jgi:predicted AAA+ superfamily ATPase
MDAFIGRAREIAALDRMVRRMGQGGPGGRPGKAVLIRGRRRVGKSRLVEEFIDRAGLLSVFFTASAQSTAEADLRLFMETVTASDVPEARLNDYDRPFHQRGTEMVVPPLTPADVAEVLALGPAEAFDAYLVSGGLPLVLEEWPRGAGVLEYLAEVVEDPTSAAIVSAERSLAAEFPADVQARLVLGAIGAGERAHTLIGRAAGGLPATSLNRSLQLLAAKRVVEAVVPLSTRPSKETRYYVADPHLRFWLAFLGPYLPEIERGRGDLTLARIRRSWTSWRGRAVEPVVRDALFRMREGGLSDDTGAVGGYWTRTNDPEIDIVGADRGPIAKRITAVGSVKWLENRPFDSHDLTRLIVHRSQLPGADESTPLVAVARSGSTVAGIRTIGPEELISAWQ